MIRQILSCKCIMRTNRRRNPNINSGHSAEAGRRGRTASRSNLLGKWTDINIFAVVSRCAIYWQDICRHENHTRSSNVYESHKIDEYSKISVAGLLNLNLLSRFRLSIALLLGECPKDTCRLWCIKIPTTCTFGHAILLYNFYRKKVYKEIYHHS